MNKLILSILFFMNLNWIIAQDKTTIIYVGDPMCSWCYGFAPEITKVKEQFPQLDFRIVLGGLRPNGIEEISGMASFLKEHWEQVNEASNQPISYTILNEKDFKYDTEPACRSVVTCRELNPEIELKFFKAVQNAFYSDNLNTNKTETYIKLAKQFNLDETKFKTLFESEELIQKTKEEFAFASQMGVSGFPAVIISKNGKLHLVCKGYMKAEQVIKNINKVIQ